MPKSGPNENIWGRYRSAAALLEKAGTPVTVAALADQLLEKPDSVRSYLDNWPALAKELNLVKRAPVRATGRRQQNFDTFKTKPIRQSSPPMLVSPTAEFRPLHQKPQVAPPLPEIGTRQEHWVYVEGNAEFPSLVQASGPAEAAIPPTARRTDWGAAKLAENRDGQSPLPVPTWHRTREFSVEYFQVRAQRIVLGKIRWQEYCKLYREGNLKFQKHNEPKPDFLPTPEEVEAILDPTSS